MLRKLALAVVTAAMTATFAAPASALDVKLEEVASGLQHPLLLTSPPGDARRFIIEQIGTIKVLQPDGKMSLFLDIKEKIIPLVPEFDERGLLGLSSGLQEQRSVLHFLFRDPAGHAEFGQSAVFQS